MAKFRAKLKVDQVTLNQYSDDVKLSAVYSGDKNSEDNSFSNATPSATLTMTINNPSLRGQVKPGDTFYVDFTPAT